MRLPQKRGTNLPNAIPIEASGKYDGIDGSWSTFSITVGSPAQTFNALISLSGLGTWLAIPDGCNSASDNTVPANCSVVRGAQLGSTGWQSAQSTTYQALADINLALGADLNINSYGPNPDFNYPTLKPDDGAHFGQDKIQFTVDSSSNPTLAAAAAPIYGITDYIFFVDTIGVGYGDIQIPSSKRVPSLLKVLANSSEISSISVGYTAGASYKNTLGSLVFGGYDINRFVNPTWNFPMGGVGKTLLQVSVTEFIVDFNNQNSQTANVPSGGSPQPFTAVIDSTLPYLYLPNSTCETLSQMLGLKFDNNTGLYTLNSTQRTNNLNNIKDIRLVLSDTSTGAASTTISLPYAAFDLQIGWPVYDNAVNYFPIRRSQNNVNILGRAFLQEAYVIADYQRQNFSIATAAAGQGGVTEVVPIYDVGTPQKTTKKSISTGAIAGIAVGAAAILAIILILAFLYFRKRKQQKNAENKVAELQEQQAAQSQHGDEGDPEKRDRRQTVDTVASTYSGATELDTTTARPRASRHLSELSSDSGGDGHARVLNPPGIIYELDDPTTTYDHEQKTDTDAWEDNQTRFGAEELAALRGETPNNASPGLYSVTPEPNRPSPFGGSRLDGSTPAQSTVSPATETPSNHPSPESQGRSLHYPSPPRPDPSAPAPP